MKTKRILSLLLAIVIALLAFTACGSVEEEGNITVVVETEDGKYEVYKTDLEKVENRTEGAVGILENLRDREENPLNIKMTDSTYGAYVTEVGSIKENPAEGAYVIVYTTTMTDSYAEAPTVEYEGAVLYASGVGISFMNIEAGTVILFRLETYS